MKAFIDASCGKCRARIGWYGTALEHPGCRRCGWKPDPVALKHDHDEMVNFRELLAELRTANPGWEKWQKARVAAGLTLRQAAKILEVAASDLSDVEQCRKRPSEALAERMARCYGG
jgi:ribosome-binding protein aMBF1 (putative translation factor)